MKRPTVSETIRQSIDALARAEWARLCATLMAQFHDLTLAEDVLQEAFVSALDVWPRTGVPERAAGWLLQTARHKAIDRCRREAKRGQKEGAVSDRDLAAAWIDDQSGDLPHGSENASAPAGGIPDERLRLIFLCCHPALGDSARTALTLRHLGGLSAEDIARAYLVSEATLRQRLVRAKRKIRASGIPFRLPDADAVTARLESVHATLYLIFHSGFAPAAGDAPLRKDLCEEAIRLGRVLYELRPADPETGGLLALMLLHHARAPARISSGGDYIPLEFQDRSLWNHSNAQAGDAILRQALARGAPGPYQIQAAISAVHTAAAGHDQTDWREILMLYGELNILAPSPIVRLNQLAALAAAGEPERAFAELDRSRIGHGLESYQPFFALRADLARRTGDLRQAAADYSRAIELAGNAAERRYLEKRAKEVAETMKTTGEPL